MSSRRESTLQEIHRLIEDIALSPTPPDVDARLAAAAVAPNPTLVNCFFRIVTLLAGDSESRKQLAVVMVEFLESPHPTGALVNLLRYAETVGVSRAWLNTLAEGKPIREILAILFGSSQYMADIIIRNPGYLYWLIEKQIWDGEDTIASLERDLELDATKFQSLEGKLNAARRFQRRMLLKIGVKDLLGYSDIEKTTHQLSDLAQAITRVVLKYLWEDRETAAPASARTSDTAIDGFAVLALGKLGGYELNYSSDIDLIYVCKDADDAALEFYADLGARLTDALAGLSPEGYLYRTDLRLRPDGVSGPLVNSLTAMRIYYESRGRPWEFQAMLKARVIAGDRRIGEAFLENVFGLFFNPSLACSPVEDISHMRTRIRESISTRDRVFNIKLMEGGIRDIEFILQTLQLLHGYSQPDLRVPNTLEGLRVAHRLGLLSEIEHDTLSKAYRFFRLVEHRLQMMHQIKTHSIPESKEETELLSRRVSQGPLGSYTYDSFLSTLAAHINKTRQLSEGFFAGENDLESPLVALVPDDEELATEALNEFGFSDTRRAFSTLQALAYGSFPRLADRTTRSAFQKLVPKLLEGCSHTGDPDLTLLNFSKIATASRSESGFYNFLSEAPQAFDLIQRLTGTSSVLTNKLCRNPFVLDPLFEDPGGLLTASVETWDSLNRFIENPTESNGERMHADFRSFLDQRLLAAWVIDVRNESFPEVMSHSITSAIRFLVSAVFERLVENPKGVALLALGSFGVGEPRIGSDLDLLVVTDGRELEPVTRSVQKMNQVLSERDLVKTDFRLRGEGANAPLVQDLGTYKRYFKKRMAPWEHVAFAKCSYWNGDAQLADAFFESLMTELATPVTPKRLAALQGTRKQLEELVPEDRSVFETKRSAGGRYDIEYLTSMGLANTGETYALNNNTEERLETLASADLISGEERVILSRALGVFRHVDFLLELQEFSLPRTGEKTRWIARYLDRTLSLLGIEIEEGIEKRLSETKRAVRDCYERFVASLDKGS
ncbi:MAG: hypothetical protein JSW58_12905 [Candidatus Latescibacterota bacterium]|nr:MAG: hypothetical protein JSW58_12905 [Candidatus Latescibacterota bacterium]